MIRLNTILTLSLVVSLTGCGAVETLNSGCGGDSRLFCDMLFGEPKAGEEQVQDLEGSVAQEMAQLEQDLATLFTFLTRVEQNASGSSELINELETQIADTQANLAELELEERVTGFIDPCGDNPGRFDEVLLVMNSGAIVSYVRDGGNREFLAMLPDGSFRTTDRQRCNFSIVNGVYSE